MEFEQIKVENVREVFSRRELPALENISFSIARGETVAVMGASGAGKSTLLKVIGGLLRPTAGGVYFWGNSLWDLSERELVKFRKEHIGFCEQNFKLIDVLTAYENIILPIRLARGNVNKRELDDLISRLRLEECVNRYPDELSGGERQRVAIARALSVRPSVLIADEPTANLDKGNRAEVMELMLSVSSKPDRIVLFSTHDEALAAMANRVLEISDGKIISDKQHKMKRGI